MLKHPPIRFKLGLLLAVLSLAAAVPARAEDALAARAQALLDETRAESNLAGMTAGVAVDGEIVWLGASGYSDLENKIPAIPDMPHRIASISKSMTAVAAMQLVERGQMALNDPIRKYVTEWPETPLGEIEIVHLLTHLSGIKHYTGTDNRPTTHYDSLTDAVRFIMNRPNGIATAPGARYIYTTYGYTVLGLAIERASGQSFGDYMRAHVWAPAGMNHTRLEVVGEPIPNKSKLYRKNRDGEIEPDVDTDQSVSYPGGGMESTAGDLLRFAMAFEGERLLARASMDRMMVIPAETEPRGGERMPYGMAWIIGEAGPMGRFIRNDGGQSGTSTNLLILRDRRICVSVICNVSREADAVQGLTWKLARLTAGVPEPEPAAN